MIKHSLLFFLFLYLQSCVNSIDTAPFYSEKAVLVGVLEPDSLISIRLTKTFLPTEEFDINRHGINNAEIEVFENNVSMGFMTSLGFGGYSLNARPKPGFKYEVIAHTSLGTLKASDSLLLPSSFTFELSHPNPQNPNSNPDFFVTLSRSEHETGNFWFSMKELKDGVESGSGWFNISSNSPFLDSFNASEDQFYPLKHYGYLARLLPDLYGNARVGLTTHNQINTIFNRGGAFAVRVSYVSRLYDLFLRSAVQAIDTRFLTANGDLNNPFYEPTMISSNIEGGLGVFGAVVTKEFIIEELK